jgi:hypothetical protein
MMDFFKYLNFVYLPNSDPQIKGKKGYRLQSFSFPGHCNTGFEWIITS